MTAFKYPFKTRSMILAPKYDFRRSTDYAIYQAVLVYAKETDILKGLTTSNDYYNNFVFNGEPLPKKLTVDKNLSKSVYVLKFKLGYLIKRLYYPEDKKFKNLRRKYGKYYRDKIKEKREIELPTVKVIPNKSGKYVHSEVYVFDGNHRVVAFYDLGFDTIVAKTEFNYHMAFIEYKDYPFVDRW